MVDLLCPRCRNATTWMTYPFTAGGYDHCEHCASRTRNGLPTLPLIPIVPLSMIRRGGCVEDARYTAITTGIGEARCEQRRRQQVIRRAKKKDRQTSPAWREHLAAIRPRKSAEHFRSYWQQKAVQLGLSEVA